MRNYPRSFILCYNTENFLNPQAMDMVDRAKQFWDKAARKYAKSPVRDQKGYEKTLNDTKKYLDESKKVLEIGCGTGTTALLLAPFCKSYTATDISPEMIQIAKERKGTAAVNNVEFYPAELFDAKIAEQGYDVILAYNLIHLLDDTDTVIKRVHDLLNPGGIFIAKTACLKEQSVFWPLAAGIVSKIMGIPYLNNYTVDQLEDHIQQAGFHILESHLYFPKPTRLFTVAQKNNQTVQP
ncbi:MAG: class I SAM-dependent methyltransferase [Candidatus Omnitrophica bacterium]|nr:class I SAM-dependent methyltransferase [Candidatus Omnitrophota bacterium]